MTGQDFRGDQLLDQLLEVAQNGAVTGAGGRQALLWIAEGLESGSIGITATTPGEQVALVGAHLLAAGAIVHASDDQAMTGRGRDTAGPTAAQRAALGRVAANFEEILRLACLGWPPEHRELGYWSDCEADQVGPHDPAGGAV